MMVEPIGIFDSTIGSLERAMQIATKRQEVIAHNIANAKTPGFEPLSFDEQLMRAVKRQDRKQVVLEEELAALTENSVKYSACVKLMSSKINILKSVASQGRR
jgi:flagellar basal body rod protein FlgB